MRNKLFNNSESPHDKRDIHLGRITSPQYYPKEYDTDISGITIIPQRKYPSCGAHAGTHWASILEFIEIVSKVKLSPLFLWKKIKSIDYVPPEDGTYLRAIFKALASYGVCDWDLLPTDHTVSLADYTKDNTNQCQLENAHPRIIKAYVFVENNWEAVKQAIYQYGAVVVLTDVGDTWWSRKDVKPFTRRDGGHFVCAYGYTEDRIKIIDSADEAVPLKTIPLNYIIREAGTAIDMPNWQVKALTTKISILKKLVELYLKLKSLNG